MPGEQWVVDGRSLVALEIVAKMSHSEGVSVLNLKVRKERMLWED